MQAAVDNGFSRGLVVSSKELNGAGLSFPCGKVDSITKLDLRANVLDAQRRAVDIITETVKMDYDPTVCTHDVHAHVHEKCLLYGAPLLFGTASCTIPDDSWSQSPVISEILGDIDQCKTYLKRRESTAYYDIEDFHTSIKHQV